MYNGEEGGAPEDGHPHTRGERRGVEIEKCPLPLEEFHG